MTQSANMNRKQEHSPWLAFGRSHAITSARPSTASRNGVALLIVLGLLGLLLITAVGFAVLMRTERSAATNYRHTSSARHLLFAGLNRALEDIDEDIGNDFNPDWPERTTSFGGRTFDAPAGVFFSYFDTGGIDTNKTPPVQARILTKDVMTYIPARFHRRLTEGKYSPPEWLRIDYNGSIIGRYAYAVIDTSGLLDASLVASTNRWMGCSMKEVQLDPDILTVKDLIDVDKFTADRDTHGRYETIAELGSLNSGIDYKTLSNFEVFSTYSTNLALGETAMVNLYNIDNAATVNAKKDDIKAAFTASGLPLGTGVPLCQNNTLFNDILLPGLIDYVDTDSVMSGKFNRPCTEMLPLANAFGVIMTYPPPIATPDGAGGFIYQYTLTHKFHLNITDWTVAGSGATDGPFTVRGAICIDNPGLGKQGPMIDLVTGIKFDVYDYFISPTKKERRAIFTSERTINPQNPSSGDLDIGVPPFTVTSDLMPSGGRAPSLFYTMYVAVEVYNKDGVMCYQFPGINKEPNQFQTFPPPNAYDVDIGRWARLPIAADFQGNSEQRVWAECVDPRFAFEFTVLGSAKPQWYANKASGKFPLLSSIAGYTVPPMYRETTSLQRMLQQDSTIAEAVGLDPLRLDFFRDKRFGSDDNTYDDYRTQKRAYVANKPLQTPGELGYLLCGPWETIKLYDHWPDVAHEPRYHTVLDHFEVRDPSAEPKGKVNLNSASEDVLSLLFLDMPLRSEKTASTSPGLLATIVKGSSPNYLPQVLGKKLFTELQNKVTPIDNLSELACIYANLPVGQADPIPKIATPNPVSVVFDRCKAAPSGITEIGEFEREAVIRNVSNLLTTRQQLFTIILRADAFTTRFGSDKLADGTVLSSANAVAQVFRDPIPRVEGGVTNHPITVRMLKILE